MKKIAEKIKCAMLTASTAIMMAPVTVSAGSTTGTTGTTSSAPDFEQVASPIVDLINSLLGPAIAIVGALGSIYCVFLGVKFAKAEEPQEREKAKSHLKNAIIGFVLIFVLMLVLRLSISPLSKWAATAGKTS